MAQEKKKIKITVVVLLFIFYFILAARPIPRETILANRWVSSLESSSVENSSFEGSSSENSLEPQEQLFPFMLGNRFGYVDRAGNFSINKIKTGNIYLSDKLWAEYDNEPANIEIKNIARQTIVNIEDPRGYPILSDNRIFILGSEQNALSEIDTSGNTLWTYEFGAPLTCIDAAAGLVLTGSIDGVIEILNSRGERVFYFEPGGSRYSIILGCAISADGSYIGIISGIEQQRFLLLERFGSNNDYKAVYHEFIGEGFRRAVFISFIDQNKRLVYECSKGLGCYDIKSRQGIHIPLNGEIAAMENSGNNGVLFLINSLPEQQKEFVGIKFPQDWRMARNAADDSIFIRAPFKSEDVFIKRNEQTIIAGGGTTLLAFELEKK